MIGQLEADQILEDLCFSNGLNLSDLKSSSFKFVENVKYLEMFFNGLPHILHMDKFPNLTELKIIAQDLTTISGLETCLNLFELWIAECRLTQITGLKNCRNLKKLYLYSNKITKIENLEQLNLEVLWLNDNKISKIEGFNHMSELSEINLAQNYITTIGNSLSNLDNLENLNLASNLIDKFDEITNLQNLNNLKHLCFKDPQYGYNPVTILCNYSLYVIYHLPGLITLDTLVISQKVIKELADSTINKKKLWYFMKLNTINREKFELIDKIENIKKKLSLPHLEIINTSICKIKDFKKKRNENSPNENPNKEIDDQIKSLQEKINENQSKLRYLENHYQMSLANINLEIDIKKKYVFLELENGGNIRFEFSNSNNDLWYKSCHELLMSRFCASDYVVKSINGIKMRRVIRVTNRVLLAKYEENLLAEVDENDYINNKPSLRKKIDYLMYCWRPKMGSQLDELFTIIKSGFKDISEYKNNGYEEAIPFTNSLSVCDHQRMETQKPQSSRSNNNLSYKNGFVILCKVYTNKYAQYNKAENTLENYHTDPSISAVNYPENFGVKRQFKLDNSNGNKSASQPISITQEFLETQRTCDCKSKQTEYFLFNKNLAVPEYVIEYEYLNKFNLDNIIEKELTNLDINVNQPKPPPQTTNSKENDKNESDLNSYQREKLSETMIIKEIDIEMKRLGESISENITELNLHNTGLTSLDCEPFKNLRSLKKLVLTFNHLRHIRDINNLLNLEYLDVSNNQIESLSGFKVVSKINHLDLSNNLLSDAIPFFHYIKQFFPILVYLDVSNNLFKRPEKLRLLLIYTMRSILYYNTEKLHQTDKDFPEGKSRLNKELAKKHSFFIQNRPRSLKYSFVTDLYATTPVFLSGSSKMDTLSFNTISVTDASRCSSSSEIDIVKESSNTFSKITTLNLDNQGLFKLTSLEYLPNLKWASFNNNYITKIEGLEKCTKLEELSLENNFIYSLSGLDHLENLRKLNVNNNEIAYHDEHPHNSTNNHSHQKQEPAHRNWDLNLPRLNYLSISNNKLASIKFLSKLPSIIEFYASFNQLKNLRDVFNLKALNALAILDLWCNPMCTDQKYRLFIIYHLKNLKSLDGCSIEPNEFTEAKELFGGKLTCDFIAEKFAHSKLSDIRSLEFPQCSIRIVDLGSTPQLVAEQFESLRSLNLENNSLTSFSGLIHLRNLKILCLNNNKIESIYPKSKGAQQNNNPNPANQTNTEQILPNLEVLHLAYNGISDLVALQISKLSALKALFLQGNEISKIEGLEGLRDLRELVLDRNKIRFIGELSFTGQSQRLLELHIEENRLRDLINIQTLRNLQKLYVANNKINEFADIDRLLDLGHLQEISLINNPISRRPHYRITMVYRLKRIKTLDMSEVNDEDRIKAEIYFSEQQQLQQQPQIYYNGMVQAAPQIIANPAPGTVSINQLDHQFLALNQSPRLKPITIVDKQLITNPQTMNLGSGTTANNNQNGNTNTKKLKNPYERINKDFQTRYRNQLN